jgi:carbon-monoxide dehydrogenase medium subunit
VKPVPFEYVRPRTIDEAAQALAANDDSKVLAGGQSLGPLLNFRLATPAVIVDINRVSGLDGIEIVDGRLVIGATARQRDVERSALVRTACPLLSSALPHVAHRTIRNRGTVVGSLTHADPAAEMPTVALIANAEIRARSTQGERTIPAEEFFDGYFTSTLAEDEFAEAVTFPPPEPGTCFSWTEFAPRDGDFAIVGVGVALRLAADGTVADLRLGYSGVADRPLRIRPAEQLLLGRRIDDAALDEVGAAAAAEVAPQPDLIASTAYRQHLVAVLTRRGIRAALAA